MRFNFNDLTEAVRIAMLEKIESDINNDLLYLGKDLSAPGRKEYPNLLYV